jgi:hypothetical protein
VQQLHLAPPRDRASRACRCLPCRACALHSKNRRSPCTPSSTPCARKTEPPAAAWTVVWAAAALQCSPSSAATSSRATTSCCMRLGASSVCAASPPHTVASGCHHKRVRLFRRSSAQRCDARRCARIALGYMPHKTNFSFYEFVSDFAFPPGSRLAALGLGSRGIWGPPPPLPCATLRAVCPRTGFRCVCRLVKLVCRRPPRSVATAGCRCSAAAAGRARGRNWRQGKLCWQL